jgi:hypothetical protein
VGKKQKAESGATSESQSAKLKVGVMCGAAVRENQKAEGNG